MQVASDFLVKVDKRLQQLSRQPFAGIPSQKVKEVRSVFITKHNRVYYKVKGRKVIVLNMYDTRMNPKKKSIELLVSWRHETRRGYQLIV